MGPPGIHFTAKQLHALSMVTGPAKASMERTFVAQARLKQGAQSGSGGKGKGRNGSRAQMAGNGKGRGNGFSTMQRKQQNAGATPKRAARQVAKTKESRGPRLFWPLPEPESAFFVFKTTSIYEVSSNSTTSRLLSIGGYHTLGLGASSGGTTVYPNPLVDLVLTDKDAGGVWQQTIGDSLVVRSAVIGRPARAATRFNSTRRARLASVEATVQCLGASSGLYPVGEIFFGRATPFDYTRADLTTITLQEAIVNPGIENRTLKSFSAQSILEKPAYVSAAPLDFVRYREWNEFNILTSVENWGSCEQSGGLEAIYLSIPAVTGTTVKYRVAVCTVYCVRDPADVLLTAASRVYAPTQHDQWVRHCTALTTSVPRHVDQAV